MPTTDPQAIELLSGLQLDLGREERCASSATTALESTPPLRKAPTGTSATERIATDSSTSVRTSATASTCDTRGPGANDSRQ